MYDFQESGLYIFFALASFLLLIKWGLVKLTSQWELLPLRLIKTQWRWHRYFRERCRGAEQPCSFQLGSLECGCQCRGKKPLWMSTRSFRWLALGDSGLSGNYYGKTRSLSFSSPNKGFGQTEEIRSREKVPPLKASDQEKGSLGACPRWRGQQGRQGLVVTCHSVWFPGIR